MTRNNPLVSCVLPFANPARLNLVRKAVNNFIYQKYTPYELIIVNGTDQNVLTNTNMESDSYLRAGCTVKEIQAKAGLNAAAMRNVALKDYAQGDYVICIDDDDYFHPDRLLYQMAHRHPENPCLLKYQLRVDLSPVLFSDPNLNLTETNGPRLHLLGERHGIASTALFPRLDCNLEPWLFDETYNVGEHSNLIYRMQGAELAPIVFDNKHTPFSSSYNLPLLSVAMYHGGNELSYDDFFKPPDFDISSENKPTGLISADFEFLKSVLRSYNFQVN